MIMSPSPEGRAAVPQLLLEPHPRVVVAPVDASLLAWLRGVGVTPLGWTGDEASDLVAALNALA